MTHSPREIIRCRCARCHRVSSPRVLGTAPTGWLKITSPVDGKHVYLCPTCR